MLARISVYAVVVGVAAVAALLALALPAGESLMADLEDTGRQAGSQGCEPSDERLEAQAREFSDPEASSLVVIQVRLPDGRPASGALVMIVVGSQVESLITDDDGHCRTKSHAAPAAIYAVGRAGSCAQRAARYLERGERIQITTSGASISINVNFGFGVLARALRLKVQRSELPAEWEAVPKRVQALAMSFLDACDFAVRTGVRSMSFYGLGARSGATIVLVGDGMLRWEGSGHFEAPQLSVGPGCHSLEVCGLPVIAGSLASDDPDLLSVAALKVAVAHGDFRVEEKVVQLDSERRFRFAGSIQALSTELSVAIGGPSVRTLEIRGPLTDDVDLGRIDLPQNAVRRIKVVDSVSGETVDGAGVLCLGSYQPVNDQGVAVVGVAPGADCASVAITAMAPGYAPSEAELSHDASDMVVALEPCGAFILRVTTKDGGPVHGALVEVSGDAEWTWPTALTHATRFGGTSGGYIASGAVNAVRFRSGEDGTVRLGQLRPGHQLMVAVLDESGEVEVARTVGPTMRGVVISEDLVLPMAPFAATLVVRDEEGVPIPGVVVLVGADVSSAVKAVSNGMGVVTCTALFSRRARIRADKPGFCSLLTEGDLTQIREITLERPRELRVRAIDDDGGELPVWGLEILIDGNWVSARRAGERDQLEVLVPRGFRHAKVRVHLAGRLIEARAELNDEIATIILPAGDLATVRIRWSRSVPAECSLIVHLAPRGDGIGVRTGKSFRLPRGQLSGSISIPAWPGTYALSAFLVNPSTGKEMSTISRPQVRPGGPPLVLAFPGS